MTENEIVWIDGMPCINLMPGDIGPPMPSGPKALFGTKIIRFVPINPNSEVPDFTKLQQQKERNNLRDILKDLEKLFSGD